jgi:hypothetical protein
MGRLDKSWLTSFLFFAASVLICAGMMLYQAKTEADHYGQLFQMLVAPPPAAVAPPAPPPKRWGI